MKKAIATVYTPDFSFGHYWGLKKSYLYAEYILDYRIRYQSTTDYLKGKRTRSVVVTAKSELDAESKAVSLIEGNGIEIYNLWVFKIHGTERMEKTAS
jgi:hypothetical protein